MTTHLTAALFGAHGAGWPEAGRPVRLLAGQVLLDEDDGLVTLLAFESLGRARHACALLLVVPAREADGPDARADLGYLRTFTLGVGGAFVRPGAGAPAAIHRRGFAAPGRALLAGVPGAAGAGAFAMLVLEATPTETAAALAGDPLRLERPPVIGVRLRGERSASAGGAEVLETLARRLDGKAAGAILEYSGEGLASLPMRDRIAMASLAGAMLGARASVFPSDAHTRAYLAARGREADWRGMSGSDEGFEESFEFDLARVRGAVPADARVRFGVLAEDGDVRALARMARAGAALQGIEVIVGGRAARAALAGDDMLQALEAAGASVRDAGDPRAQAPPEAGTLVCGDDAAVASGHALPVSSAALAARFGVTAEPTEPEEPAGAALPSGEVLASGAPGQPVSVERAGTHVPPAHSAPFAGSPRGVVLRADPGDVACEDVLGRGPRAHAARSDDAMLARLSSRRADAEAAGRSGWDGFGILTAAGRYGEGAAHDAAARATRALGIRVVIAATFAPEHARALAAHGVLPLAWRTEGDAIRAAAGDELEFTGVGEALARGRDVPVRVLSRGWAIATRVALDEPWRDVAQAGGLLAMLSHPGLTTTGVH